MGTYDGMGISQLEELLREETETLRVGIEKLVAEGNDPGLEEIERALGRLEDPAEMGAPDDPLAELAKLIGQNDPFSADSQLMNQPTVVGRQSHSETLFHNDPAPSRLQRFLNRFRRRRRRAPP